MKLSRSTFRSATALRRVTDGGDGFVLILTLLLLAAITLLVLGLFTNSATDGRTAQNYNSANRAQDAVESGLARAQGLLRHATWSDDFVVLQHLGAPTAIDDRDRRPSLMIARAEADDGASFVWKFTPLISGVQAPADAAVFDGPTAPLLPSVDPVTQAANATATSLPKLLPWMPAADSYWEALYDDSNPPKPVARYCFRVEDMQGALSLDHAGNPGDLVETSTGMESRQHEREKFEVFQRASGAYPLAPESPRQWYAGLAPGMRTPDDDAATNDRRWVSNQAALYNLFDPKLSKDIERMDNVLIAARLTPRLAGGKASGFASLIVGPDAWKSILLKNDTAHPWATWLMRRPPGAASAIDPLAGRLSHEVARRLEESLISGVRPYHEFAIIPVEPGVFEHPREPKLNLNRLLEELDRGTLNRTDAVNLIADHIDRHLPDFRKRAGTFPLPSATSEDGPRNYLRSLAAAMIDYADVDALPTMEVGQYRGVDSAPFVSEHFLLDHWENSEVRNGRRIVRFSLTFFFELWNMSNRPVTGEFEAEYINHATLQAGTGNFDLGNSFDKIVANAPYGSGGARYVPLYGPGVNGEADPTKTSITLRPNEYTVVGSLPVTFEFDAGPSAISLNEITVQEDERSPYVLRFKPAAAAAVAPNIFGDVPLETKSDFTVIDRSGGPVERNERRLKLTPTSARFGITGVIPGSGYGVNNNFVANNLGDPRAAFFIQKAQALVNYGNGGSPWGRNYRQNVTDSKIYGATVPSLWPDRGHDTPWGARGLGSDEFHPFHPSVLAVRPAYQPLDFAKSPSRISNAGRFFSETELGNIYDPLFWDPNGSKDNTLDGPDAWMLFWDIGGKEEGTGSPLMSGGGSLRIGRPEHRQFRSLLNRYIPHERTGASVPGLMTNRRECASALLDLFHCGISTVGSTRNGEKAAENLRDLTGPLTEVNGQVNVNTASRDVLRCLVGGRLVSDPAVKPAGDSDEAIRAPGTGGDEADALVDAIINSRPFLSRGEMAERVRRLARGQGRDELADPLLGVNDQHANWIDATSEWNDAAAEEVFARLYNSTTVRSRNFRVFVTGQAVQPLRSDPSKVQVLSTRSRVFHVFVHPLRDPETGLIVDQRVEVTYEQDL